MNISGSYINNDGALKGGQLGINKGLKKNNSFTNNSHNIQPYYLQTDGIRSLPNNLMSGSKTFPIKPTAQRQTNSNLEELMNAFRKSNAGNMAPNSKIDEKLKKREDKALEKQCQSILSNSNPPLNSSQGLMGLGSIQNAWNAIVNNYSNGLNIGKTSSSLLQSSSDGRKSSSEQGENLKPKTPVKIKHSKSYETEEYSSPSNNHGISSSFLSKSSKSYVMRTPRKYRSNKNFEKESEMRASRVKNSIKEGDNVKLILESDDNSRTSDINLNIGSRNVMSDFNSRAS